MTIQANSGALAFQHIRELIREGFVLNAVEEHLQPSSLDLSISGEIYRMRGSFLPRQGENARELLKSGMLFPVSLAQPLELNGIYWIRLNESLDLPDFVHARTNNKSSSGRINLQTRLIVSGAPSFDRVPRRYKGELWLEVIPKSFPVKLGYGERLNQIRFFTCDRTYTEADYRQADMEHGLLRSLEGAKLPLPEMITRNGIPMSIDLTSSEIVGYKCSPTTTKVLDYSARDHKALDFFEPIHRPQNGQFIMKKGEFYIFVTKEYLRVPNNAAAEMLAYDETKGEFRSHYAGFFDPGWGGAQNNTAGTPGVLEIFTHDHDFILRDGQPICQMIFEHLSAPAEIAYGDASLSSNYYNQSGPRLSKHFKMG
ncbi:MAG: 2'-deoxycytidine 5'-triphosphate deaminase [bacterium]|nr:2'-deoxycytidine 5'-triphosphate deaminase [bacterium]